MNIAQRRTLERHLHERHVPESDHLDLSTLDKAVGWLLEIVVGAALVALLTWVALWSMGLL